MEIDANRALAGVPWERAVIEKLLLAQVREQRTARLWGLFRKLLILLLLALVVLALFAGRVSAPVRGPHTAVVEIKGEIARGADASAEFVLPALREAMEDKDAKALVLLINSPGGSPVQAGIINDEIARLRKKHDKPVYAVVEDTCASGAYYIAAAADKIYVDKASLVGSIGVLMNGFGFVDTLDKLGVERRLLTAGENKGFLDPFSPMTAEQKQFAQAMLDQIHRQFIAVVKKGRGERLKETPEIFSGLFWNGEQAIDLGLADAYGSLDSVAREVVNAEKIVDYTNKANAMDRLAKRLGVALGQGAVGALREMPQMR